MFGAMQDFDMVKTSAGLLMYKIVEGKLMVFIGHPGGPFFAKKDEWHWSIPKGEVDGGDNGELLETARREFEEETGIKVKTEEFISLGFVQQKSGKIVHAWAFEGDWSGLLTGKSYVDMEYHGKKIRFPEIDRAGFFDVEKAKKKLIKEQGEFVDRLRKKLDL